MKDTSRTLEQAVITKHLSTIAAVSTEPLDHTDSSYSTALLHILQQLLKHNARIPVISVL